MTMSGDLLGNFVGLSLEPAKGGWRVLAALPARGGGVFGITSGSCRSPRWLVLKATNDAMVARGARGRGTGWSMMNGREMIYDWRMRARRWRYLRSEDRGSGVVLISPTACLRPKKRAAAAALLVPPDPARQTPEKLDEIEREIDDIVDVIKTTSGGGDASASPVDADVAGYDGRLRSRHHVHALRRSGVSSFAKHIFEMTGRSPTLASGMTTALAFVKLVVTVFVAASLETFGRRRMLLTGISIQCVATSLMAYLFDGVTWIEDPRRAVSFQLLGASPRSPTFAVFANAGGFHLSFGPLRVDGGQRIVPAPRAATITALNSMFSWTLSTVTVRFLRMMNVHDIRRRLITLTCLFAAVWFVYLYVPETKDERWRNWRW